MDATLLSDLRRQSRDFFRAPHQDHNRRPLAVSMDELRRRRVRRRYRGFLRAMVRDHAA